MNKTEFIRAFLLELDVLGVYHPDNQNEDEYDAYINFTIDCLDGEFSGRKFAISFIGQYFDGDDSRKSIEDISTQYDVFIGEYQNKFHSEFDLARKFWNATNLQPKAGDGYESYVTYIARIIVDNESEYVIDYISEFFITEGMDETIILNIFNDCIKEYKDKCEDV